jgi:hypothetical protein
MQPYEWTSTFQWNMLPPSSGLKMEATYSSKSWYLPTRLYRVTTKNTTILKITTIKTSKVITIQNYDNHQSILSIKCKEALRNLKLYDKTNFQFLYDQNYLHGVVRHKANPVDTICVSRGKKTQWSQEGFSYDMLKLLHMTMLALLPIESAGNLPTSSTS